ncbi:DegT/DnrJ/EryC1/StrS family aminotransferase [Halovivax sp.]|uniref:DegT/DnrJ/EryC1/StrS family aminotransferase n=1 Tax=Halovivax sp. TaxID=1935978 RepID=UPI0025B95D65|nr:DegT/DnrJ/EryC1/StrS family aminotransferase [Halovivax sp.]
MISGAPSLFVSTFATAKPVGIDAYVERHVDEYRYYGSGKLALRDGLRTVSDDGDNVLLPAYVPDAVAEPIRELGLEARYYAIRNDLGPDMADLEARLDAGTVAVVSVNYFGFPQPGLAELSAYARDNDCYHVDDNAHSALSVHEGRLLGTVGDLGITCLWKSLPLPDGALLYLQSSELRDRFEPSPLTGVNERFQGEDLAYVCKSFLKDVFADGTLVRNSLDALVHSRRGSEPLDPSERYESTKAPMSKLSAGLIAGVDPMAVRTRRRENYRAWLDVLADRPDVVSLYHSLPDGICPQSFPAYAETPERLLADLAALDVEGAHAWPRLSRDVDEDPAFETASRLARHVVSLPVHQHVNPEHIAAIGDAIVD